MYEALTEYISKLDDTEKYAEWESGNDESDGHVLYAPEIKYSKAVMRFANQICAFEEEHPEMNLKNYMEILEESHIRLDVLSDDMSVLGLV